MFFCISALIFQWPRDNKCHVPGQYCSVWFLNTFSPWHTSNVSSATSENKLNVLQAKNCSVLFRYIIGIIRELFQEFKRLHLQH